MGRNTLNTTAPRSPAAPQAVSAVAEGETLGAISFETIGVTSVEVKIVVVSKVELIGVSTVGVGKTSEVSSGALLVRNTVGAEAVSFTGVVVGPIMTGAAVLLRETVNIEEVTVVLITVLMIESPLSPVVLSAVVLVGRKTPDERLAVGVTRVALKFKLADALVPGGTVAFVALNHGKNVLMVGNVDEPVAMTNVEVSMSVDVAVEKTSGERAAVLWLGTTAEPTPLEDTTVGLPTTVVFAMVVSWLAEETRV